MTAALQGIRVLDLSRYVAGAYCAKLCWRRSGPR